MAPRSCIAACGTLDEAVPREDAVFVDAAAAGGGSPGFVALEPLSLQLQPSQAPNLEGEGSELRGDGAVAGRPDYNVSFQVEVLRAVREQAQQLRSLSEGQQRLETELQALKSCISGQEQPQQQVQPKPQPLPQQLQQVVVCDVGEALPSTADVSADVNDDCGMEEVLAECASKLRPPAKSPTEATTTSSPKGLMLSPVDAAAVGVGSSAAVAESSYSLSDVAPGSNVVASTSKRLSAGPNNADKTMSASSSLRLHGPHSHTTAVFARQRKWVCPVCDEPNSLDHLVCNFCGMEKPDPTLVQRIVQHWSFDFVSGLAIVVNAVTIAISSRDALARALENPGGGDEISQHKPWEEYVGWGFAIFYTMEVLMRACAQGRKFVFGEDWGWNAFDCTLVLLMLYENLMELFASTVQTINIGWLRVLRLLKMMKVFRVVRLVRFFRMLRLMVTQIIGSMMMLFWGSILLFIMMFLFSLCFAHGMTEYLLATPAGSIPPETKLLIDFYWPSLEEGMVSLYKATTGGADWEGIALPLQEASGIYYTLFLFYIGFSALSVLNVVSSLFVDSALKISEQDEHTVQTALAEREEVADLVMLFHELDSSNSRSLSWLSFKRSLKTRQMEAFLRCLSITLSDVKRVFKLLQHNGVVGIDEFMSGCIKMGDNLKTLNIVQLQAETKRNSAQVRALLPFFEERFQSLLDAFRLGQAGSAPGTHVMVEYAAADVLAQPEFAPKLGSQTASATSPMRSTQHNSASLHL